MSPEPVKTPEAEKFSSLTLSFFMKKTTKGKNFSTKVHMNDMNHKPLKCIIREEMNLICQS